MFVIYVIRNKQILNTVIVSVRYSNIKRFVAPTISINSISVDKCHWAGHNTNYLSTTNVRFFFLYIYKTNKNKVIKTLAFDFCLKNSSSDFSFVVRLFLTIRYSVQTQSSAWLCHGSCCHTRTACRAWTSPFTFTVAQGQLFSIQNEDSYSRLLALTDLTAYKFKFFMKNDV